MTFEPRFTRHRYVDSRAFRGGVKKYASLRKQIAAKVNRVLDNPYDSELLGKKGASDLRGKRSVRVTRNIRIVFAVCVKSAFCAVSNAWASTIVQVAPKKIQMTSLCSSSSPLTR